MKKLIISIGSAILLALLAIIGLNIYSGRGPRERVKAPDGSKVVTEELSYYVQGKKVFGKLFRPDDSDASKKPLVIYFHEPLKTGYPETVLKTLVTEGLVGYATGFRGKDKDAVTIVKRLSKEEFAEKDMVFLISDAFCADEVIVAASRLGHRIQGLVLIEPNPKGKAREIYQAYGREFLTVSSSQKGNAV